MVFFLICNIFTINSCVYNSTFSGIKRVNNKNKIKLYNEMHPYSQYTSTDIVSDKNYMTYKGKSLYYYNLNEDYMKDIYTMCDNNRLYFKTIGSSITAYSIVLSTIYDNEINPLQIYYEYIDNHDICNELITIESIYETYSKSTDNILVNKINSSEIYSNIINGNIVIAKLVANEDSKLTCDSDYIVIYNIDSNGNYFLLDPSLRKNSFICPYSSYAYGNTISSNNMKKSWSLEEISKEATDYYVIMRR